MCRSFRESEYDIAGLVRTILSSRHFFSEHAYRQKVKSPVDLAVGSVWSLTGREVLTRLLLWRRFRRRT